MHAGAAAAAEPAATKAKESRADAETRAEATVARPGDDAIRPEGGTDKAGGKGTRGESDGWLPGEDAFAALVSAAFTTLDNAAFGVPGVAEAGVPGGTKGAGTKGAVGTAVMTA